MAARNADEKLTETALNILSHFETDECKNEEIEKFFAPLKLIVSELHELVSSLDLDKINEQTLIQLNSAFHECNLQLSKIEASLKNSISSLKQITKKQVNKHLKRLKKKFSKSVPSLEGCLSRIRDASKFSAENLQSQEGGKLANVIENFEARTFWISKFGSRSLKTDFETFKARYQDEFQVDLARYEDKFHLREHFVQSSGSKFAFVEIKVTANALNEIVNQLGFPFGNVGADRMSRVERAKDELQNLVMVGKIALLNRFLRGKHHDQKYMEQVLDNGENVLHCAAKRSDPQVLKALFDAMEPSVRHKLLIRPDLSGTLPITMAVRCPDNETFDLFVSEMDNKILEQASVLRECASFNECEKIRLLIAKGVDVNFSKEGDMSPLEVACENGHLDAVKTLLSAGAKVNKKTLESACKSNSPDIVRHISEILGDDILESDDGDKPILNDVAAYGSKEMCQELIKQGFNVEDFDEETFETPFLAAAIAGNKDNVQVLAHHNPDVLTDTGEGDQSALHFAVELNDTDMVKELVELKIDPNMQDDEGNTALQKAVEKSQSEDIDEILQSESVDVNQENFKGQTALSISIHAQNQKIAEKMINHGANVDLPLNDPPLLTATQDGWIEMVEMLLENDANPAIDSNQTKKQTTPLIEASKQGNHDIVDKLLKARSNLDCQDRDGDTSLHKAIQNSDDECTAMQIDAGCNLTVQNNVGDTPVHEALKINNPKILDKVFEEDPVDLGLGIRNDEGKAPVHVALESDVDEHYLQKTVALQVDANLIGPGGRMPLATASKNGKNKFTLHLIEKGTDVDHIDDEGKTAAILSAENGNAQGLGLLVDSGCDLSIAEPQNGNTAAHLAVMSNNVDLVKAVSRGESDLSVKNKDGNTPLHVALDRPGSEVMKVLLDSGRDDETLGLHEFDNNGYAPIHKGITKNLESEPLQRLVSSKRPDLVCAPEKGRTPLTMATEKQIKGVVKDCLAKGADVNFQDDEGQSALILSATNNDVEITDVLLENDADITLVDNSGDTAVHISARQETHELLERHTEYITKKEIPAELVANRKNESGNHPLYEASYYGRIDNLKLLLKMSDPNLSNAKGWTCLHASAFHGHIDCIEELLGAGADIDHQNFQKSTALTCAVQASEEKAVEVLIKSNANLDPPGADFTPAQLAVENRNFRIARALVNGGTDITKTDSNGCCLCDDISSCYNIYQNNPDFANLIKDFFRVGKHLFPKHGVYVWNLMYYKNISGIEHYLQAVDPAHEDIKIYLEHAAMYGRLEVCETICNFFGVDVPEMGHKVKNTENTENPVYPSSHTAVLETPPAPDDFDL